MRPLVRFCSYIVLLSPFSLEPTYGYQHESITAAPTSTSASPPTSTIAIVEVMDMTEVPTSCIRPPSRSSIHSIGAEVPFPPDSLRVISRTKDSLGLSIRQTWNMEDVLPSIGLRHREEGSLNSICDTRVNVQPTSAVTFTAGCVNGYAAFRLVVNMDQSSNNPNNNNIKQQTSLKVSNRDACGVPSLNSNTVVAYEISLPCAAETASCNVQEDAIHSPNGLDKNGKPNQVKSPKNITELLQEMDHDDAMATCTMIGLKESNDDKNNSLQQRSCHVNSSYSRTVTKQIGANVPLPPGIVRLAAWNAEKLVFQVNQNWNVDRNLKMLSVHYRDEQFGAHCDTNFDVEPHASLTFTSACLDGYVDIKLIAFVGDDEDFDISNCGACSVPSHDSKTLVAYEIELTCPFMDNGPTKEEQQARPSTTPTLYVSPTAVRRAKMTGTPVAATHADIPSPAPPSKQPHYQPPSPTSPPIAQWYKFSNSPSTSELARNCVDNVEEIRRIGVTGYTTTTTTTNHKNNNKNGISSSPIEVYHQKGDKVKFRIRQSWIKEQLQNPHQHQHQHYQEDDMDNNDDDSNTIHTIYTRYHKRNHFDEDCEVHHMVSHGDIVGDFTAICMLHVPITIVDIIISDPQLKDSLDSAELPSQCKAAWDDDVNDSNDNPPPHHPKVHYTFKVYCTMQCIPEDHPALRAPGQQLLRATPGPARTIHSPI